MVPKTSYQPIFRPQALADRHSPAYEELYEFLVACFVHADVNKNGKVRLGRGSTTLGGKLAKFRFSKAVISIIVDAQKMKKLLLL